MTQATLFFGISLSSEYYRNWVDHKNFVIEVEEEVDDDIYDYGEDLRPMRKSPPNVIRQKVDEEALAEFLDKLDKAIYQLWNSYIFGDELARLSPPNHDKAVMGKCISVDDGESEYTIYLAIRSSEVSTNGIDKLGSLTPDPPEWKGIIDKAVALIEERLEQELGQRILIPTKGEIQWHLAAQD